MSLMLAVMFQAPFESPYLQFVAQVGGVWFEFATVADQLGHLLDVSMNLYTHSPVELRAALLNEFELLVIQ